MQYEDIVKQIPTPDSEIEMIQELIKTEISNSYKFFWNAILLLEFIIQRELLTGEDSHKLAAEVWQLNLKYYPTLQHLLALKLFTQWNKFTDFVTIHASFLL